MRAVPPLLVLLAASALPTAAADVLHVPGDHPTIQAAVDASRDGDVVLVAPGVYVEAVVVAGRTLALRGEAGAAATVVDAGGSRRPLTVVRSALRVEGLTLRGGDAPLGGGVSATRGSGLALLDVVVEGCVARVAGGGVHADASSSLRLEGCVVRGNVAEEDGGGLFAHAAELVATRFEGNRAAFVLSRGGGLALLARGTLAEVVCRGNEAGEGGGAALLGGAYVVTGGAFLENAFRLRGGGLLVEADRVLVDGARLSGNVDDGDGRGGGLHAVAAEVVLRGAELSRNRAEFYGGLWVEAERAVLEGCAVLGNAEGGARVESPSLVVRDTRVAANESTYWEPGLRLVGSGRVERCLLLDNRAETALSPATPGGLELVGGSLVVADTVVARNHGPGAGGIGVLGGRVRIDRCTVTANVAGTFLPGDGGALGVAPGAPAACVLRSTILYGNDALRGAPEIADPGGLVAAEHCDVAGGWPGLGNFDLDPLFRAPAAEPPDYALGAGSPCVDAGAPLDAPSGLDLRGRPRLLDGDLDGRLAVDVGAVEVGLVTLAVDAALAAGSPGEAALGAPPGWVGALLVGAGPVAELVWPLGVLGFATRDLVAVPGGLQALPAAVELALPPSASASWVLQAVAAPPDRGAAQLSAPLQVGAAPTGG